MDKREAARKIKEIDNLIAYLSKLTSELKEMIGVSSPILKRQTDRAIQKHQVKIAMRAKFESKFRSNSSTLSNEAVKYNVEDVNALTSMFIANDRKRQEKKVSILKKTKS